MRHRRALLFEAGHFQDEIFSLVAQVFRHAVDAAEESDIFLDGEVVVEREFLRHVADVAADGFGLTGYVESAD